MELNALRSITAQIRPPATDRGKAGGHVVAFDSILNKLREMTHNTVEQGRAFEDLCEFYFARDPLHTSGFAKVQRYADWARERGLLGQDTGVDLVATLRNAPAGAPQFCAIQCKFFMEGTPINRKGIDSFLVKSATADFARRIIVDTTGQPFGKNMLETLERQEKPVQRIGLNHLRNSRIDWEAFLKIGAIRNRPAKSPLPHQKQAIKDVLAGFEKADRGKMLMACATGKTYTALKIAERRAGYGGRVLFLAPSLALVSQAIRDWCNDASQPLLCYAVCSDSTVGKTEAEKEVGWFSPSDLEIPASTSARALANAIAAGKKQHRENMVVVFATYHSVQRVIDAQHKHGLGEFDLVVCDEAHRTTGLVEESKEQSEFVKVHNAKQLRAKKRLYMTATPRIYSEGVKSKAKEKRAELWSMDDPALFGEVFYEISFAKAVTANLLTDYKVIILDINKEEMSRALGSYIQNNDVQLDDAALMLGCYRAIAKMDIEGIQGGVMSGAKNWGGGGGGVNPP